MDSEHGKMLQCFHGEQLENAEALNVNEHEVIELL